MEFRILGPLEVEVDGRPLPVPGVKERILLTSLLLEANHPVPSDRLLDALWPEGPPATADVALRVHISHLRRALGDHSQDHPRIEAVRPGYMVHVAPGELDVATFQQLVIEGQAALRRHEPALAVSRLRTALGLWRWVPLSDIVPEAESWPEVDRLIELRLAALENRIEADLALGRDAEVLGELEVLVEAHPLRERLHGQLMLALYRVGRQTDALEAYRRLRTLLADDLGLDPSPALQRLERAILRQEADLEAIAPEPAPPTGSHPADGHDRQATGSMVDERKRVTVMICDLASAAIDRAVDPEGIHAMSRPYYHVVREQIRRVDGSMLRFFGNSMMAVLGVPSTHEDDAARAVRAGLRIVQQVDELNETIGRMPLTVRIGVATGDALVLAGEVDEGLGIVGDVVNRAVSLCDLAASGSVAVGEDTYEPTQDFFEYRALATDGASSERAAWQPIRVTVPANLSLLLPRSRAFIGRQGELRRLRLAFARMVKTRSPGLVIVAGEPGVGKTRVVGEFLAMLQERGERIAWRVGRCLPYAEAGDLWPLAEVIKDLAAILETDDPSVALTKLDGVVDREVTDAADRAWIKAGVAPLLGVNASGGPAAATPGQVLEASKRLLHACLARAPLVLVFEDVQNADTPTLGFVESLLSPIGDAPLLVICTARRDFLKRHPTWPSSRSRKARISLDALPAEEAAELVHALLAPSTPAEELVRWVLDGSGGNPLYIGELVRALQERESLIERDGIVDMVAHGRGAFPDSLQSLIAARVDALAPDEKALLQDASVAGRVFWSGVLASVGDRDEEAVAAGLSELVERGLVRRLETTTVEGQVEYVFWHGVTRDAVYERIPRAVRVEKHRAVAEWIERLAGDRIADRAGRVAYHYSEAMELAASIGSLEESAGLEDRTRRFLLAAGDAACNVDLAAAQEWYERALAFTPRGHPSQPAVVSRLAHAAYRTGGLADSAQLFEEAIEGFRAERNILGQGDTMVRFSACLWTKGESARSQAMLREAVALLEGETPGPELVRGYAALAFQKAVTEPSEEAIAWADKTLALAERFGLAEERVAGVGYRGLSRCFLGDSGGVDDLREAVALAKAAGLISVVSVMFNLAFVLWPREGPAVALACYRDGVDTALRRGFRNEEMAMRAATVGPLYELGRWSEALSIGNDVITWLHEHGADYDRAEVEHRMAQVLLQRGDVSAAEGIVERCLAAARETGDPELTVSALVTSALVAQRKRDGRRALRLAREADAAARAQPGSCRTEHLPDLVRIALAAKDLRLARRLLESPELNTTRDEHAFVTARAVVAEGEAEFRDAALLYGEAAERWAAFGLLLEQGMGRLGEGRCLAAVGAPGASSALRRARRIFHMLGARVV